MTPIIVDAPATWTFSDGLAERDARLLVAGDYPGKNLRVTEADLDQIVAHFSDPVPVKVEHIDTPLDPLGHVQRVWRDGASLMGRIAFPAPLAAFLSQRGAEKLSVGLLGEPAWRLLEASLTLRPHVPGATLLSDGEAAELVQLRADRLDGQIARLKAAGKLVPAAEPLARALLTAPSVVTLAEGESPEPVGDVFRRFLEAQPPVVRLSELARAGTAEDAPAFSDDENELLRRLGVAPGDVAQTMAAERRRKEQA